MYQKLLCYLMLIKSQNFKQWLKQMHYGTRFSQFFQWLFVFLYIFIRDVIEGIKLDLFIYIGVALVFIISLLITNHYKNSDWFNISVYSFFVFLLVFTLKDLNIFTLGCVITLISLESLILKLLCFIAYIVVCAVHYQLAFDLIIISYFLINLTYQQESQLVHLYNKELKLFAILNSLPTSMCIINNGEMVYQNDQFEVLAHKLMNQYGSSHEQNNCSDKHKFYMDFIQRFELKEIKNDGFQINNLLPQIDDEGVTEDQFKILKIEFKKYENDMELSEFYDKKPYIPQQIFENLDSCQLVQQTERKSFLSTLRVYLQIFHQPKSYIQSALTKKRKQSSNNMNYKIQQNSPSQKKLSFERKYENYNDQQDSNKLISPKAQSRPLRHIMTIDQQIQEESQTQSGKAMSLQKLRFLIDVLNIKDMFKEELKIYIINDLSPLLSHHKVRKMEQVKKNILRSLSHELRTNLNAIKCYIGEAAGMLHSNPKALKYVNLSQNYIQLQQYKLQDFFDYRDILEEQLSLKEESFDLKDAIDHCVELVRDQCTRKYIFLGVDFPQASIIVLGDQQRFCQVLLNLICNGIKYTNNGGINVIVSTSEFSSDTHQVQIKVVDSGIGMKEDQLGILHQKLLISDDNEKVTKNSVGIGVGLLVCKSIIKIMGPKQLNSLFVESNVGKGTSFFFYLNCEQHQSDHISQTDIPEDENIVDQKVIKFSPTKCLKRQDLTFIRCQCDRILVVDDEYFNIDVLSRYLKQLNKINDNANNGLQALQMVEGRSCTQCIGFRAILMDINMPIMNGWDSVQRIRQIEQDFRLIRRPIIAITAFGGTKDIEKCLKMGFDKILIKPTSQQEIQRVFRQYNI